MDNHKGATGLDLAVNVAACYVAWLGLCGLGLWLILRLRANLLLLLLIVKTFPWVLWAIDKLGILVLGVVGVVLAVFLEDYLRNGLNRNLLAIRIARIFLVEVLMLGMSFAFELIVG